MIEEIKKGDKIIVFIENSLNLITVASVNYDTYIIICTDGYEYDYISQYVEGISIEILKFLGVQQ
tara:strand:+ start:1546 stop:1740 length:195 start_codon:yes stop_codon:yes gene_type:complete